MLHHRQQFGQVGCLYFSLYAIIGDEEVLAHADDVSDVRFYVRLAELGLLAFPFWVTPPSGPATDAAFWEALRGRFTRDNAANEPHAPLLIAFATSPPWLHSVALALPVSPDTDTVQISDSNFSEPFTLPWAAFLLSDYARAHRVEMLGPLDLDAYPPDTALSMV